MPSQSSKSSTAICTRMEDNIDAISRLADADAAMAEQSVQNTERPSTACIRPRWRWKVQRQGLQQDRSWPKCFSSWLIWMRLKLGLNIKTSGGSIGQAAVAVHENLWEKGRRNSNTSPT